MLQKEPMGSESVQPSKWLLCVAPMMDWRDYIGSMRFSGLFGATSGQRVPDSIPICPGRSRSTQAPRAPAGDTLRHCGTLSTRGGAAPTCHATPADHPRVIVR